MKKVFYPKLAASGISKNKKLYVPYCLTGIVMIMMFYILSFLSKSPLLTEIKGGATLKLLLPFGTAVIGIFSAIFLFYTNSFMIRQRNKEFGLYNILGMNKKNINRVLFFENVMTYLVTLILGLGAGILFSKVAELLLLQLMDSKTDFTLRVSSGAVIETILIFTGIYFVLMLNSMVRILLSKPLELFKSDKVGEKPPKANWVIAILGIIILAIAYYIAVRIEDPIAAIEFFFIAVILVILATYFLFIAGSVALCKLLQKSKHYYYRPKHFISTASMVYRMKRNGAGLASICILATMVLVMVSSTASLYFGGNESYDENYPYDFSIRVDTDNVSSLKEEIDNIVGERKDELSFYSFDAPVVMDGDMLRMDEQAFINTGVENSDSVGYLSVLSVEDYAALTNQKVELKEKECMLFTSKDLGFKDKVTLGDKALTITKLGDTSELPLYKQDSTRNLVSMLVLVVNDKMEYTKEDMPVTWKYNFNVDANAKEQIELSKKLVNVIQAEEVSYRFDAKEADRSDFLGVYGGLFFIGIMLSIVFLLATVIIIYYKQISEGFEDKDRYDIMKKVGMQKKEIRKTINSQVVTVFFAPLVMAALHLAFALPIILKLLVLFQLYNTQFIVLVTVISYAIFAGLYAFIYKLTANAYFNIVK